MNNNHEIATKTITHMAQNAFGKLPTNLHNLYKLIMGMQLMTAVRRYACIEFPLLV